MKENKETANGVTVEPVFPDIGLWRLAGETNGYLIVQGSEALLIDCPRGVNAGLLKDAGLPEPSLILHTQVQAEHCFEWQTFPGVPVEVAKDRYDLATYSLLYREECNTVWASDWNWDDRGAEPYGIAGCITARPPQEPLHVTGTFESDSAMQWNCVTLQVVALPGSDGHAVGFFWEEHRILFSGDLLLSGGYCANLYDIERAYGLATGYEELRKSLELARSLYPSILCPTTGSIITEPENDISACLERIEWMFNPSIRRYEHLPESAGKELECPIDDYRQVLPGLYQQTNQGNIILYINSEGEALMMDPGPCYWLPDWQDICERMHRDLDQFEREAGLKRVAAILLTHFHGDHTQFCDLVRDRYSARILAPPDITALVEHPEYFPYPGRMSWYGFPSKRVEIDETLDYGETVSLAGIDVTPVRLHGHSCADCAYVIPWQNEITACTGDVLQNVNGETCLTPPIIYNDAAGPGRSILDGIEALSAYRPGVIVGGHSCLCYDPKGDVLSALRMSAAEINQLVAAMVAPGELDRATTPPGYDAFRELLKNWGR